MIYKYDHLPVQVLNKVVIIRSLSQPNERHFSKRTPGAWLELGAGMYFVPGR